MSIENPSQLRFKKYILSKVDFSLQGRVFEIWVKYDDIYTPITSQAFESFEAAIAFFQKELTEDVYTEVVFDVPYHVNCSVGEICHIVSCESKDTPNNYLKICLLVLEKD